MDLLDKIRKIEALIEGAKTEGEQTAALLAKQRLLAKKSQQTVEYSIRVESRWKKRLLLALCHKYNLKTYRYPRQKHTTTMLRVSKAFLDEILWPEYRKYSSLFDSFVEDIIEDLIHKIHHGEAEEVLVAGELPNETTFCP